MTQHKKHHKTANLPLCLAGITLVMEMGEPGGKKMPENRKSYVIFILGLFEKISYTVLILGAKTQCCLLLIQWFEISSGRAGHAEFCFLTSKQFASYIWISRNSCTRKNSEGEEKMAWETQWPSDAEKPVTWKKSVSPWGRWATKMGRVSQPTPTLL